MLLCMRGQLPLIKGHLFIAPAVHRNSLYMVKCPLNHYLVYMAPVQHDYDLHYDTNELV